MLLWLSPLSLEPHNPLEELQASRPEMGPDYTKTEGPD